MVSKSGSSRSPVVGLIMGSQSDWSTMKLAAAILVDLGITFEKKIVSAHRTPDRLYEYAKSAASRGIKVIIAGAGGAAHLPGMTASLSLVPVLGVPIQTDSLSGTDSLFSMVQMPAGVPVGTLAIGSAGAKNAALLAGQIIALSEPEVLARLEAFRARQTLGVADAPKDGQE